MNCFYYESKLKIIKKIVFGGGWRGLGGGARVSAIVTKNPNLKYIYIYFFFFGGGGEGARLRDLFLQRI